MSCTYDEAPLTIKRGDTDSHAFLLLDDSGIIDVSGWTNLKMAVNPSKTPADDTEQLGVLTGALGVFDGDTWIVFDPPGTWPVGDYYYDASRVDENGRIGTFIGGTYTIVQDITKE